ncbi:MAG: FixH family protein [Sulfuritalea sp.]|nr:FixH family protein [Sulfuritalea sp.]
MNSAAVRPWYREPWPWILAAGPLIVVIAAFYTAWLAIKSNDGLVTDDYYKKGLAANQTIARSEQAAKIGLVAGVRVTADTLSVRLQAGDGKFALPPTLAVTISHPTRAGLDQSRVLTRSGDLYSGDVRLPAAGHWLVLLEDEQKTWRLMGNVVLPANGETLIGSSPVASAAPADIRN